MSERLIIGAMLRDNGLVDVLGLEGKDFQDHTHQHAFLTIKKLIGQGMVVTPIELSQEGVPVADYEPGVVNATHIAERMKEATRKRQLEVLGLRLGDMVKGSEDSAQIIENTLKDIHEIAERTSSTIPDITELMYRVYEQKLQEREHGDGSVSSGYPNLDHYTGGFRKGEVTVLAARTSMGKTALALNMATRIALKGTGVLYFSAEMSATTVIERVWSSVGTIPHEVLIRNKFNDYHLTQMSDVGTRFLEQSLAIDDTRNIKMAELESKVRLMKRRGCEIVFVDYLTLIGYGDKSQPKFERVGDLIKELRRLAGYEDLPIVVLSQLNRNAEGNKPNLSELRQSGEIEEHSDVILFIHRERGEASTELIVAKNRNGPTGIVNLYFDDTHVRFTEISHDA